MSSQIAFIQSQVFSDTHFVVAVLKSPVFHFVLASKEDLVNVWVKYNPSVITNAKTQLSSHLNKPFGCELKALGLFLFLSYIITHSPSYRSTIACLVLCVSSAF